MERSAHIETIIALLEQLVNVTQKVRKGGFSSVNEFAQPHIRSEYKYLNKLKYPLSFFLTHNLIYNLRVLGYTSSRCVRPRIDRLGERIIQRELTNSSI